MPSFRGRTRRPGMTKSIAWFQLEKERAKPRRLYCLEAPGTRLIPTFLAFPSLSRVLAERRGPAEAIARGAVVPTSCGMDLPLSPRRTAPLVEPGAVLRHLRALRR
jgi:hypothetical protein